MGGGAERRERGREGGREKIYRYSRREGINAFVAAHPSSSSSSSSIVFTFTYRTFSPGIIRRSYLAATTRAQTQHARRSRDTEPRTTGVYFLYSRSRGRHTTRQLAHTTHTAHDANAERNMHARRAARTRSSPSSPLPPAITQRIAVRGQLRGSSSRAGDFSDPIGRSRARAAPRFVGLARVRSAIHRFSLPLRKFAIRIYRKPSSLKRGIGRTSLRIVLCFLFLVLSLSLPLSVTYLYLHLFNAMYVGVFKRRLYRVILY